MSSKPTFEENLKRLKDQYASQLPEKTKSLTDDWEQIRVAWNHELITRFHRNVHSLIGTSGTFGFSELSTLARELETVLKPFTLATPTKENLSDALRFIEQRLKSLLDLAAKIGGNNSLQHVSTSENINKDFADASSEKEFNTLLDQTLIYYLDDDLASSSMLTENLNSYGFITEHFRDPSSMLERIREQPPALVLLDLIMPDVSEAWIFNLSRQLNEKKIKTFILSGKSDFECRLSAVRSGATTYIVKPANIPALVNSIRAELNINAFKPPHVLMVDDQISVLDYYSNVLSAAGIKVEVSDNPLDVLDCMERHRPDLIILDLNMPLVKGDELAAVIRQFPEYQSIPILFFSNDALSEKKTELLEIGSDDLLHKGMPISELVRQIKSRVDRAKILSAFMYEDSLTGLLNHAQIQLAAERHFSSAKRHQRLSSIVMIDLDNFKGINDNHGHQTGDKVIKALSQLLQQRLRSSDVIGRYGGEEFMVILPETSVNDAGSVINEIRKVFNEIEFYETSEKFKISFSAGVAEASHCTSFTEQIRKADEALYRAKSGGKNKVCMNLH
jgi:diguanylate cyclase (GGDEF)-like protein